MKSKRGIVTDKGNRRGCGLSYKSGVDRGPCLIGYALHHTRVGILILQEIMNLSNLKSDWAAELRSSSGGRSTTGSTSYHASRSLREVPSPSPLVAFLFSSFAYHCVRKRIQINSKFSLKLRRGTSSESQSVNYGRLMRFGRNGKVTQKFIRNYLRGKAVAGEPFLICRQRNIAAFLLGLRYY
jgi:hypothetical protein